ncbi:MFS transporter [Halalkalibacter urbisdiaboli]|uniref:MFS transporter n=1 Tax=Halalkalibacter urbisdiaboli TaxID=1960589 RepID=UPI000B430E1B|nr:MFS transporter [Halalkalibacter urbisdiaboli]
MMEKKHYGWFVLYLCFFTLLSVQGVRLSFGAFIQPWETEFNTTRGTISLIATLSFIIYGISQPILGKLIDVFGVRKILSFSTLLVGISTLLSFFVTSFWQIILLYGIISSIGFGGASNVAASVAVNQWFQRKKGLAIGILTAGMSSGQLVIVPLCLFFIEWFNWKLTVMLLGSFLITVIFPLLHFFFRTPTSGKSDCHGGDIRVIQDGEESYISKNEVKKTIFIFKNRNFWLLAFPFFICGYTTTGLMDTHLIPLSHDHGFSMDVTGTAVSLLAVFNIIGTLFSGQIADYFSNRKFLFFLYLFRGLTILLLLMIDQALMLIIFAILFGLVDFATVAPTTMLASEFFRNHSLGLVLGLLSLFHQVGSALGAFLPGALYDKTGGYTVALISAIVLLFVAAFTSFVFPENKVEYDNKNSGIKPLE